MGVSNSDDSSRNDSRRSCDSKTDELLQLLLQRSNDDLSLTEGDLGTPGVSGGLKQSVLSTGVRLVLASQVWLNTLPTKLCDVMIVMPSKLYKEDDDETIEWIMTQIRRDSRLIVEIVFHAPTNVYAIHVTAEKEDFLKGADLLQMRKRLKEEFGGGMKDFSCKDADCFVGVQERHFLTTQERALIILTYLNSLRALADSVIRGVKLQEGEQILPVLRRTKLMTQILPLHHQGNLKRLKKTWVNNFIQPQPIDDICDYFGEQIGMYFAWLGHYTTALTIPAFLGLFHWLLVSDGGQGAHDVSIVSFAVVNILWGTLYLESWKRKQAELAYRWGTLAMETDLLQEPRPEFKGQLIHSSVTGRLETYYPEWKRQLFRYCVSYPLTAGCIILVFFVMLAVFQLQEVCTKEFSDSYYFSWVIFMPKVLLAIIVTLADDTYGKLAEYLNNRENYRTDEAYENNLITKTVLFQFVNSFLSLFYIAFYLNDLDRLKAQLAALLITRQVIGNFKEAILPLIMEKIKLSRITYNMTKTMDKNTLTKHVADIKLQRKQLLASPTAPKNIESFFQEKSDDTSTGIRRSASPASRIGDKNTDFGDIVISELRHRKGAEPTSEDGSRDKWSPEKSVTPTDSQIGSNQQQQQPQLTQAEVESLLPRYTSPLGDYLEMYIQFGLVLLFSPAFPLAAACALINNLIEIHVDAFKLCNTFQRPFGKRVENIGYWQDAMEVMGVIGVIVNCTLIVYSGVVNRYLPDLPPTGQLLIIIALEHIVLAVKFFISIAIPDVPQWVTVEMSKVEFKRRAALRKVEDKVLKRRARSESITK